MIRPFIGTPCSSRRVEGAREAGSRPRPVPGRPIEVPVDTMPGREALGYHSVWTAEAYGSDALSPLAYLAALTDAHQARHRASCSSRRARRRRSRCTAMTIDALAGGGRMIIGLGVSGPQIVEGWYGQPWGKPNARLRDYVTIVRKVLAREHPVAHDGPEIPLPYHGPGRDRAGQAAEVDPPPAPGHRDLARRRAGRRNTSSRRSSATAGCRWASARAAWRSTATRSTRASPGAPTARARTTSRSSPAARCDITDDVQGGARQRCGR